MSESSDQIPFSMSPIAFFAAQPFFPQQGAEAEADHPIAPCLPPRLTESKSEETM